MKKIRIFQSIIFITTLIFIIFIFAGCKDNNSGENVPPSQPQMPTPLTAPIVTLENDTAIWQEDLNADRFEISIDGNLYYLENTITSKKLENGQTFKIRAIGDNITYLNSAWSNEVIYEEDGYSVYFYNYNGVVVDHQLVLYGESAVEPQDPVRIGYTFIGWDIDFTNITKDTQINAVYVKNYSVTFVNYNGTILDVQTVASGNSAVCPIIPTRTGFNFIGWDCDFSNVTSDITVKALFTINTYTVKFIDGEGEILKEQVVEYDNPAIAPENINSYVDWSVKKAYTFTGWNKEFSRVFSDMEIKAEYQEITTPILAVKISDVYNAPSKKAAYVYMLNNPGVLGIGFTINYSSKLTKENILINETYSKFYNTSNMEIENGIEVWMYADKQQITEEDNEKLRSESLLQIVFDLTGITLEDLNKQFIISVSYEGNSIVDNNLQIITPETINGVIKIN